MNVVQRWFEARPRRLGWAWMLVLAALWTNLGAQLSVEWGLNPQYSYGWGVPGLALYLFWQRWRDRPPPTSGSIGMGGRIGLGAMVLGLLPVRLVQEANPDWRLVSWVFAAEVVGISLIVLCRLGGRGWVRHFSLAVIFILMAVPWPTPLERAVTQSLMRGVAAITVESVNWCGLPAVRAGNLIHLPNGTVGIDEACSGVRSFQATLMAAVFLGELCRLRTVGRWGLIGSGVGLALLLNVGRAFWLTVLTGRRGLEATATWHDPAGYAVLLVAFAGLWGLTRLMRPAAEPVACGTGSPRWPTAPWLMGLAGWLLAVELGNEAWYRAHERGLRTPVTWRVAWPYSSPGFKPEPIDEEVRRILRISEGEAGIWRRPDRTEWTLYWFRWKPGRASAQLARLHSPEVCLPATGLKMKSFQGVRTLQVAGVSLGFRVYVFEAGGRSFPVFYCLWEDRQDVDPLAVEGDLMSRRSRLRAVWTGRRHLGQQVLEVAIGGTTNLVEAERLLADYLHASLRVSANP